MTGGQAAAGALALLEAPQENAHAQNDGATLAFFAAGRHWVVGLEWATPLKGGDLDAEARVEAGRRGVERVALRQRPAQFGLPHANLSATRSGPLHSAAASLADLLPGTWCGAWPLADGRCILMAAGAHGLLPEGDLVVADEATAKTMLRELLPQGTWRRIYAPADWLIGTAKEDALEDLLKRVRHPIRLVRPARGPLRILARLSSGQKAMGLGLVCVLGMVGVQALRPAMRLTDGRKVAASNAPAPPPVLEWAVAVDQLQACLDARDRRAAALRVPGWPATSVRCAPGRLEITVQAAAGTVSPSSPALLAAFVPDAVLQPIGTEAKVHEPLVAVPVRSWPVGTPLAGTDAFVAYLRAAAERVGGKATVSTATILPGQAPGAAATATWTLSATMAQAYLRDTLRPLAAAELTDASYDPRTGAWILNGVLHVAP